MLRRVSPRVWVLLAMAAALVPFLPGLSMSRLFYTRDLSLFFWGRHLWFRRTLLGGEWPLWDPWVGGGQSAVADALHQMFFPPALATRLLAGEVLGFNLWVALFCPAAAAGAWLFFARRFSRPAAALGAIAFAASGVVVSTGNFPNLSWSVAAMPWVLWATDRMVARPSARRAAVVAVAVALQALAGEPVTGFTTLALASLFAVFVASAETGRTMADRARLIVGVEAALVLGLGLAAIQLLPMGQAALGSNRTNLLYRDFWSLHPLALLEMLSFNIFGNYFTSQTLDAVPWMRALYTGREPFFYSMYLGAPLAALAAVGLGAPAGRRWAWFWTAMAAAGVIGAFGANTPIYPFVRDHVPVLGSFRFPVKYLVLTVMAVSAAAAAGWDALAASGYGDAAGFAAARRLGVGTAAAIGLAAAVAVAGCLYFTTPTAFRIFAIARGLGIENAVGATESMLGDLPGRATQVLLLALAAGALVHYGTGARRDAPIARWLLFTGIVVDLVVHAWGVNPVFDAKYLAQPAWTTLATDPDARFYVGGKVDGTLALDDLDSSRAYYGAAGLQSSAARAVLSNQAAFYPSAWRRREMLSYDLAILWPRDFDVVTERFKTANRQERDRFLDRTGVRYRILPPWSSEGHQPLTPIPYFLDSHLYDWGEAAVPRASVVGATRVVADRARELELLYADGWNSRETVILERQPEAAGASGAAVEPFARVTEDRANRVALEAGAGAGGGYLVLLDSYAADWRASVDGRPAEIVRADGLFRAVRLAPGRHTVTFAYRPVAFYWGAAISGALLCLVVGLAARRERAAVS